MISADCGGDGVLVLAYLDLTGVWVPSSGDLQQSSPHHISQSEGAPVANIGSERGLGKSMSNSNDIVL